MTRLARILLFAVFLAIAAVAPRAHAQTSNICELAYVSGRPGSEVLVTLREARIPSFYRGDERIFLQFRRGRLTGWKNDWRMRYGQLF